MILRRPAHLRRSAVGVFGGLSGVPEGHHGLVVKAGLYGPKSRPAHGRPARPGGRSGSCVGCYPNADASQRPRDKAGAHRFAEKLPRRLLPAATAGHRCLECATESSATKAHRMFAATEYPARNVAAALIAVGNGSSYYRAARTARTSNGWARQKQLKLKTIGANGTLAGDWVGMFAPIVCGPVLDAERWPDVVAFDEQPFIGSRKRQRKQRSKQETSWAIFGAFANPVTATLATCSGYMPARESTPCMPPTGCGPSPAGRRSSSATAPASGPRPSPWSGPT